MRDGRRIEIRPTHGANALMNYLTEAEPVLEVL